jgi:hypothetical protein
MDPQLSDYERLLRNSAPQPRAEFVRELEHSLVRSVQPRRRPIRWGWRQLSARRLVAAGCLAGAVAAALLVLSIAGVQPFGTSGTSPAQADRKCVTVEQRVRVRQPYFRVDAQGQPQLSYRVETLLRPAIRCR